MSADRNAEIWSTRLQKELLALTTDNASDKETQEVAGVLPSFIRVKSHQLDINEGVCTVSFVIDVPSPESQDDGTNSDDIIVVVDASLSRKPDGTIDVAAGAYPFRKPRALLEEGEGRFPPGSSIQNGSGLDIDCDWTPSLHLTDAVLNVGLKVKESLLQKEPLHAQPPEEKSDFDEILQSARRFGSFLGKSAKSATSMILDKPKSAVAKKTKKSAAEAKKINASDIKIGDEIHLLEAPWVECKGLYSCKAIRRPTFVEDAIFLAAQERESSKQQVRTNEADDGDVPENFGTFVKVQTGVMSKVAGAGLSGAGAMFRSFTQSAKSVLEESFLMITDTHIIELRSSKLNLSVGTVTFAISIELMAKLKFRRQESVSLFFKPSPDDPLIYMCPDSAAVVHQIQTVLKAHGVKGKHTNAATQKHINDALQLVQEIQAKERALEYQPSSERVSEIMDLYRQAAELFEAAGDIRHEEVVTHLRKFLALPLTASILDGSYKPEPSSVKQETKSDGPVPEGEVLERTKEQLEADDDSVGRAERNADDDFTKNIDSVLKEAQLDFEKINDGLDDDFDDAGDHELEDLDAMLAAADADLADLMSS